MTKLIKKGLPLNLQLFADGNLTPNGEENTGGEPAVEFVPPQSQSDLDSIVNKAVQAALANRDEKHQLEVQTKVQEALAKEKNYAKLSEEEREKREFDDEKQKFLADKQAFEQQQRVLHLQQDLLAKGLPSELAETFALHTDNEKALEAVNTLKQVVDKAVADKVRETISQPDPSVGGKASKEFNLGASLAQKTTNGNII